MVIKILQQIQNNIKSQISHFFLQFLSSSLSAFIIIFQQLIYKRIMIENTQNLPEEIDINQKRLFLSAPQHPKVSLISNIIIYCSQNYPSSKVFAAEVIRHLSRDHLTSVYQALQCLFGCLERQIISGPSSSHIPASEIPTNAKLDSSFTLYSNSQKQELAQFLKAYEQLGLEKLIPKPRVKQLLWYSCQRLLSMRNIQQNTVYYKFFREEVEIDGQSWLQSTPFPGLIALFEYLLEIIASESKFEAQLQIKFRLLWARLAQLHNKHLKSPVKKLCSIVLSNYKAVVSLSLSNSTFEDYIELLLQYSYSLLFYYKYSQCETLLRHCSSLLNMKIEFTGKLGRRTKYQVFDTPLLVMDLVENHQQQIQPTIHDQEQNQETQKIELIDAKELVARERGIKQVEGTDILSPSGFDQESILLQSPKFVEEEGKESKNTLKEIKAHHLLVALGIIYFQWRSTPHDQMLLQNVAAAISTLLKHKNVQTSFSYNFALLLLRSLNQFPRLKNVERALDQLQKLKLSFNGKANKDTSDVFATPYETHLGFIIILAEKYMEIGLSITAVELFEQAGLFQECIDGLIAKNYKEKAEELARRLIDQKGKNPRILCMLGDIHKSKEIHLYEQAWEMSKGTCARAQRSLGWHYFSKNEFQKAAESFTKATQASYYHPNTWFTLGCCYMRMNQFDKALKAFSECISIDDSQGEAWGNMASCYMYNKKMKEAYATLIQAVKYSQSNWKLWANLLSVSLSIKQFYKYFESIQRIVILGHQQLLSEEIFSKVVKVMRYQNETCQRKRIMFNYKNRIDRLFSTLQQKIGQNPLVWRGKTLYQIQLLQYYDILDVHYHNLHLQQKIDVNDLVPDYETLESTSLANKIRVAETKATIVESKQYELNMTMKIGWEQNKVQCQRVKTILEEYVDIYKQYSTRADKADFKLFIEGVAQKIGNCLEEAYQVILEWL